MRSHITIGLLGFALLLAGGFFAIRRRPLKSGVRFRLFMLAYMSFRFAIEFIKPTHKPYAGLSAIQLAALATALIAAFSLYRGAPEQ